MNIQKPERSSRLGYISQLTVEVPLMLLSGHPEARLCDEIPEWQWGRQALPGPAHDLADLANHHVLCGVILDKVMNLHEREPPPAARLGGDIHPHQRRAANVDNRIAGRQQLARAIGGTAIIRGTTVKH